MIYKVFFASALSLASSVAAKKADTRHVEAKVAHLKAEISERLQAKTGHSAFHTPVSEKFEAKLTKNGKAVVQKEANMDKVKFDEETGHLRSLKTPDNFAVYTEYSDSTCSTVAESFGFLVNYCFNQVNTETGDESSYLYKIAKKDQFLVEVEYDGFDCEGIPSKVVNIFDTYVPEFPGNAYGACFYSYASNDAGAYVSVDYLTTYPDSFQSNQYVSQTFNADDCTADNSGYIEFNTANLNYVGFPTTCIEDDGNSYIYDFSTCSTDYNAYVYFYVGVTDCSGVAEYVFPVFESCPTDDDDEDDDDDDHSGSTTVLYDTNDNSFCT